MCLSKVQKFKPCTEGFKVFSLHNGRLTGCHVTPRMPRPTRVRLDEKQFRMKADRKWKAKKLSAWSNAKYPFGWHVWHDIADAKKYIGFGDRVIRRVKVEKPLATGIQNGERITICRYITILPAPRRSKCTSPKST